jgi:hypothetical protein
MLDLERPPYSPYVELLNQLRESELAWPLVAFQKMYGQQREGQDANQDARARVTYWLLLQSEPTDLPLIRYMLDQEIRARVSHFGATDTAIILSILLMELGDEQDTLRFYRAKYANFDTGMGGYDSQFLFTWLSPPEVIAFLEANGYQDPLELMSEEFLQTVQGTLPEWRASLSERFPRSVNEMTMVDGLRWAKLFEDKIGFYRLCQ